MQVDKAVCTTDPMANIESSRRYETLLSTLVQNKILAIKRDCELKQRKKEQRKRNQNFVTALLFGKHRNQIDKNDNNSGTGAVDDAINANINTTDKSRASLQPNAIEVDKYYLNANNVDADMSQTQSSDFKYPKNNDILCITTIANTMDNQSVISATCASPKLARENNDSSFNEQQQQQQHKRREQQHDQNVIAPLTTVGIQNDVQNIIEIDNKIASTESLNDAKPIPDDKTTAIISVEMNADSCTTITTASRSTNSKSSSMVSQIDGCNESIHLKSNLKMKRNRTDFLDTCNSDTIISAPNLLKHKTALNASTTIETAYDYEQWHRLRILDAKSISAQCSPIFAERQIYNSDSTTIQSHGGGGGVHRTSNQFNGADMEHNNKTDNNRLLSTQKYLDKDASGSESKTDSIRARAHHVKDRNELVAHSYTEQRHKTNGTSTNKTKRVNNLTFFKRNDKVSKCCDANNANAHGFISSFNQLTSNNLPVIASTKPTTIQLTPTNTNNKKHNNNYNNADDNRINSGAFLNDENLIENFMERKISNSHRDIEQKDDIRHKPEKSKYSEYLMAN